MKKVLFIDLEDTVIDELGAASLARLMNIESVRAFIAQEGPGAVRLFSFALWDGDRVALFRKFFEARLNQALGLTLDTADVFATGKLFELCKRHGTVFESDNECMLFHGKDYGFQHFIEMSPEFDDSEVVLLDDSVTSKLISYPARRLTLRMVNVADLV